MRRRAVEAVLVLALVPLAGCLVKGTIEPSGAARVAIETRLASVAHFDSMKASLQSADVTLKDASMTPKKLATFEVESRDVRKLRTAQAFATTRIALSDGDAGTRTLHVTIAGTDRRRWPDTWRRYFGDVTISIDVPGDVVRSNATSTSGRTVSWTWPLSQFGSGRMTELDVTFRAATS
jgi:hypothetical protein